MGVPVLLYGKSGAGKTFSLHNLTDAAIIKIVNKPLSFKKQAGLMEAYCPSLDHVMNALTACPRKTVVIDDSGYLMTRLFMDRKRTGNQFETYNQIAGVMWNLMNYIIEKLSSDKIVYIVMHEDVNESGEANLLTIGKLLNQKVCLEGMVTVTIHAIIKDKKHLFRVNSDGSDISKSPFGMFETDEIENDLSIVDRKIREFYNM